MPGKQMALRTRKLFGTSDPELIAQQEGLEVIITYLPQRWWDVLLWDYIAIREDLVPKWRRWCLAHSLGHHFMHHGNQLRLAEKADLVYRRRRQEADAEAFAAWLLVPPDELEKLRQLEGETLDGWSISEHFGIPHEMVPFRLGTGDNPYLNSIGW